jgi:serine/threonine protein kinase
MPLPTLTAPYHLPLCPAPPPPPHTQTCAELAGTLEYMAPEVLGRCYDLGADIWAAGVMAAQLLTGVLPFPGATPKQVGVGVCFDKRGQGGRASGWVEG